MLKQDIVSSTLDTVKKCMAKKPSLDKIQNIKEILVIHKRNIAIVFAFFVVIIICMKFLFGSSDISVVKDTPIAQGSNITIGDALDDYKFFSNQKWDTVRDDNGIEYVKFTANYNIDGIYETLFVDKKSSIPEKDIKNVLKKAIPDRQQTVLGIFKVNNKKISDSIIQMAVDGKIVVPMSLSFSIFTKQAAIPDTLIGNDDKAFYYYHFNKYCLQNYYKYDTEYYYPRHIYGSYYETKFKISKFRFDDENLKISADSKFIVSKDEINVMYDNSEYTLNNKIKLSEEEFKNFIDGKLDKSPAKNISFKEKPFEIDAKVEAYPSRPFFIRFRGMDLELDIRILSLKPFTMSRRFHAGDPKLINDELKVFFEQQSNRLYKKVQEEEALQRKLQNSPVYALIWDSPYRGAQRLTLDYKGEFKGQEATLNIHYNSDRPDQHSFTLNVPGSDGENLSATGICKDSEGLLDCVTDNQQNNIKFGLGSTNRGSSFQVAMSYSRNYKQQLPNFFHIDKIVPDKEGEANPH